MRSLADIKSAGSLAPPVAVFGELLEELQKCAEALGPDSPRGISALALVAKYRTPVLPPVTGPHEYQPF